MTSGPQRAMPKVIWWRRFSSIKEILLIVCMCILIGSQATVEGSPRPQLWNAKLGLFVHYVFGLTQAAPGKPPLKNVNKFADDLNVNGIADMASAMGAQYVVFTAYHWRMTMLFPCSFWGREFPHHVCRRNVIVQLADALKKKGIKLVLYIHPDDRHDFPKLMLEKLIQAGWSSPQTLKACMSESYPDCEPYDRKWNRLYYRVLNFIGGHFGRYIAGYWVDDGDAKANGEVVGKIMSRYTHNPAVWLNGFATHPPDTLVGSEDWNLLNNNPRPCLYNTIPNQAVIVVASTWWACKGAESAGNIHVTGTGKLMYSPDDMYRFLICQIATKGQKNGGVVFASSPYSNNQWEAGVPSGLTALGKLIRQRAKSIYNTVPSRAYVSGDSISQKPDWGVAVDSINGKTVYLHVLIPPKGRVLQIGRPADHVTFSSARLLNGRFLAISRSRGGYKLTLPAGVKWSAVDTVIALRVK